MLVQNCLATLVFCMYSGDSIMETKMGYSKLALTEYKVFELSMEGSSRLVRVVEQGKGGQKASFGILNCESWCDIGGVCLLSWKKGVLQSLLVSSSAFTVEYRGWWKKKPHHNP